MDERTRVFIAEIYLDKRLARDYSDWLVECVENGIETKNIRILASMFIGG